MKYIAIIQNRRDFVEIIELYGEEILGTKINLKEFPLLIKPIAADDKLSVQVHPNDEYANAIFEGVVIAEIQQNSDTTYRVYDYNRGRRNT